MIRDPTGVISGTTELDFSWIGIIHAGIPYPVWTYLTAGDTAISRQRCAPIAKHTVRFSLAYSPFNAFGVASPEGQFNTGGVFGFEAGLDYFYKNDRYLYMALGAAMSATPVDYFGKPYIREAGVLYASIRNN